MNTVAAPVIHRADYRPLAWKVEYVDLYINLDPHATQVTSTLQCVRNPAAPAGPLQLFGENLALETLHINGTAPKPDQVKKHGDMLEIDLAGDEAEVLVVTRVNPADNLTLSGLYLSNGGYFTQCEAEGFRRITYFPDRPDIMARYAVLLEAESGQCPVLLCNGNLVEAEELANGRRMARWEDPFPKPSYLFALVAAQLSALEKRIHTASEKEALLQIWVEERDLDRTEHAMNSLIRAIRWDERTFGLELDLERFMIVAVSDFNMGAMENKGLNIFNAKYVLAKPDTATDTDYENIESVIAHEYFHNWTGNRVTCRDWFQLTLKEGLTVFRDQQFSADMLAEAAGEAGAASARAVKRIDDVRVLRSAQFTEDSGPMAHPIRPDSYREINNFYTATVYEKGAEVIRMQHTLLGAEKFRKGMDLYFSRYDGQAVTCDDFVGCMAEAGGRDMEQFMRWYSQAGTPHLKVEADYDPDERTYTMAFRQHTPPTPDQQDKQPLLIPVALGLIGRDGRDLPLRFADEQAENGAERTTRVLEVSQAEQVFRFVDIPEEPVPSVLRGFSAPVVLELDEDDERLAFRMAHDSDAFNRWDAAQRYAERVILALAADIRKGWQPVVPAPFIAALSRLLHNDSLDAAFRAQAATLPGEAYLLEQMEPADPGVLRQAVMMMTAQIGEQLAALWLTLYQTMEVPGPYRYHPADAGKRALRNLALRYLTAAADGQGLELASRQFEQSSNMTERIGALAALVNGQDADLPARKALAVFYARYRDDALVLDKWFALQAGGWRWPGARDIPPVLTQVRELMRDPAFSLSNPNKVYALLGSFFRANPAAFHTADGEGYVFWADQIIALDSHNPQVAARMARAFENWRRYPVSLQALMEPQLKRVQAVRGLSADVGEIIEKALAGAD